LSVIATVITGGLAGVAGAALFAIGSIVLGLVAAVWGLRLGGRRSEPVSP
jgi:hypothetical protein